MTRNRIATMLVVVGIQGMWAQSAGTVPKSAPPQDEGLVGRALGVLAPSEATPLTARQRFHDYLVSMVGPLAIVSESASTGISQWRDSPPEWGQGGSGYGKRFASKMAHNAVRHTIIYGASTLLQEDNRYFASGRNGVKARVIYAVTSPVAGIRHGRRTVSFSSVSGMVGSAAISQAWAPPSQRGADDFAIDVALTYAGIAGLNVVREFVPDLIRKLRK